MSEISDIIKQITRSRASRPVLLAKVDDVDESTRTATVSPVDGSAKIYSARLQSSISATVGVCLVPAVDSFVLVVLFSENAGQIVGTTDIDKILFSVGEITGDADQITINGGNNDGIVKVVELTQKLNALENKVNDLVTYTATHIHSGVTTGPGSTGVAVTPVVGALTPTNQADIENDKIKH